ncbi:hypothetical protein VTO58DRAFT_105449 [Aureobasidium pullulans]
MPSVQEIFPADAPSGTASHVPPDWQTQKAEGHLVDEALIRAENEDKMIPYLAYLISSAALGGFLYGYDTGVIGQEIATAATTFGSIFGASILGMFADKWGRKPCLLISDLFFTAGAIVIAFSFSLAQLIVGRLILGVGVGGAAVICPLYITELTPTAARGRCVGTNGFCIPFGQTVAVAIVSSMATYTRKSCFYRRSTIPIAGSSHQYFSDLSRRFTPRSLPSLSGASSFGRFQTFAGQFPSVQALFATRRSNYYTTASLKFCLQFACCQTSHHHVRNLDNITTGASEQSLWAKSATEEYGSVLVYDINRCVRSAQGGITCLRNRHAGVTSMSSPVQVSPSLYLL